MMCRSPEALWCDGRELLVRSRSARVPLQFAPHFPAPRPGLPVGAFAPRLTRKRDAEINHPSSFCVCLPLSVCCPCPAPLLFLNSRRRLFASIKEDPIDFPSPEWDPISAAAKELVGKMLCKDPRQRISAMGCVEHAWVTEALDEPLPATFTRLKNYQLKKKWKRGVRVAEAAECFGHLGH